MRKQVKHLPREIHSLLSYRKYAQDDGARNVLQLYQNLRIIKSGAPQRKLFEGFKRELFHEKVPFERTFNAESPQVSGNDFFHIQEHLHGAICRSLWKVRFVPLRDNPQAPDGHKEQ